MCTCVSKSEVEREGLLRALKELQLTNTVEARKSKEEHKVYHVLSSFFSMSLNNY